MNVKRVRGKYGAIKTQVDGIVFASRKEANRYIELKMLQDAGHISKLELQPVFKLAPAVRLPGAKRTTPALRYVADFRYLDSSGRTVVEDAKGVVTSVYKIKRHLMATLHNIFVAEI